MGKNSGVVVWVAFFFFFCNNINSNVKLMKPLAIQGSDFAVHAIDIAANELIALATPGEGLSASI